MNPARRHIIVGIDSTDTTHNPILTAALEHAWWTNAELCLVQALPVSRSEPDDTTVTAATAAQRRIAARVARVNATASALRRQVADHVNEERPTAAVHYDVRYGDPATVLLMAAQQADLIVLGTRVPRRTTWRSPFVLGSVSQDVAVNAACPVLLIPTSTAVTDAVRSTRSLNGHRRGPIGPAHRDLPHCPAATSRGDYPGRTDSRRTP